MIVPLPPRLYPREHQTMLMIAVAASFISVISAQQTRCAVSSSALTVSNNTIFIYGGEIMLQDSEGNIQYASNSALTTIDITRNFSTTDRAWKFTQNETLPDDIPLTSWTSLWPTGSEHIDLFCGKVASESELSLDNLKYETGFRYQPNEGNRWSKINSRTEGWSSLDSRRKTINSVPTTTFQTYSSANVWAPGANRGYQLGGSIVAYTAINDLEFDQVGLLVYEAKTNVWKNESMPVDYFRTGALVTLQSNTDDILISFGGSSGTIRDSTEAQKMHSMRKINIYATSEKKWYTYTIPDDEHAPRPRRQFCSAVVRNGDRSSYQILIYGGREDVSEAGDGKDTQDVGTVWALSVPTMQWTQLPVGINPLPRPDEVIVDPKERVDPACMTIGDSYMLMYGGQKSDNKCEEDDRLYFLLDLNIMQWVTSFKPDRPYLVPEVILAIVGGNARGGANKSASFNDEKLAALMNFEAIEDGTGVTSPTSSASPSPSSSSPSSSSHKGTNKAAIAGGVCGGILAVSLVGFAIFMYRRRRNHTYSGKEAEVGGGVLSAESYENPTQLMVSQVQLSDPLRNPAYRIGGDEQVPP